MDKRHGILLVSVTILVLCLVGTASATNWSVDGSGGADFTGIQDAINNASAGDTIIVHSGVYYENVVVNKSVTLKGIGQPVVDAGGEGDAIRLTADGITLVGFNATNSGSLWGCAGINVISSNNTITGNNVSNNNDGIHLWDSSNNTITGNNVSNNDDGIHLYYSSNNNTITGNNVSNNDDGISLYRFCNNNSITGNNVSNNNDDGISLYDSCNNNTITGNTFVNDGLSVSYSYQNTVEENTVNGKPLVYLKDVSDFKVEDAGQVILVNCNNITIENLDLSNTYSGITIRKTENSKISNNTVCNNNWRGIQLYDSCNNRITGNNVSNNDDGISLWDSSNNNSITGNNVSNNNDDGIYLRRFCNNNTITGNNVSNNNIDGISLYYSSNNNTITGNNVSNNNDGIHLWDSSNNSITGNNVSNNNDDGIHLWDSSNNTITGNNVSNNNDDGISLWVFSNNSIYLNNFINNTDDTCIHNSNNMWNSPLEITYTYDGNAYTNYLGNYWDDYGGTDAEGDGIGDIHYSIDSDSDESDDYPLMDPFENYNITTSHE